MVGKASLSLLNVHLKVSSFGDSIKLLPRREPRLTIHSLNSSSSVPCLILVSCARHGVTCFLPKLRYEATAL